MNRTLLILVVAAALLGVSTAVVEREDGALEANDPLSGLENFRFASIGKPPAPPAAGKEAPAAGAKPGAGAPPPAGAPPAGGKQTPGVGTPPKAPGANGQMNTNGIGAALGAVNDPLNMGASPPGTESPGAANTLPPYNMMHSDMTVSPGISKVTVDTLNQNLGTRIKQAEDLLNRMTWQMNRETSWANSVHDIIQNYQYKYTRVLSNIKKHSTSIKKMQGLLKSMKQARMHEILEADLAKATKELTELAASSSETSEDENSYPALKDRAALLLADLEKSAKKKVHKVSISAQEKLKKIAAEAVPPPSSDTLKSLNIGKKKK